MCRTPSVQPAHQATLKGDRPVAFRLVQEHERVALVAFGGPHDDEQTLLYVTQNGTYILEDVDPLIAERMGLRLGDFDNLLLRELL